MPEHNHEFTALFGKCDDGHEHACFDYGCNYRLWSGTKVCDGKMMSHERQRWTGRKWVAAEETNE